MRAQALSRPLLRDLGGKFRLAQRIIGHFPPHDTYVEPFGGAASLLLLKPPVDRETYNDLDGELVNLFRVLRSPAAGRLIRLLELTPYARAEYLAAFEPSDDPVEQARRTIVRSHMAHGNMSLRRTRPSGLRVDGLSGNTNVAANWADFPGALRVIVDRLRRVSIEQMDGRTLIAAFDGPRVLVYVDPPYVRKTRLSAQVAADSAPLYTHEMSDADHEELVEQLVASKAMVLVSGYPSDLYNKRLQDWRRVEIEARAHRNSPRTEALWINQLAQAALDAGPLFREVA